MKSIRSEAVNILLIALSFAVVIYFWDSLPDPMPTHWGAKGQVNGWTPKPWGPLIIPLMTLGIYLLFLALPAISPRGFRMEGFIKVFRILRCAMVALMFLFNLLIIAIVLGAPLKMERVLPVIIGLSLMVIGNYLGKVSRNFFVGIRTPWTLASEEVWLRTHRLGGRLFVLGGMVMIIAGVAGLPVAIWIVAVALASLTPMVYSYFLYRRLEGFKGEADN